MITINFAMVAGIYYFLNRAQLPLKIFAFIAYMLGMLLYLGEMLIESTVKVQVSASLRVLPSPSPITRQYLGVNDSWLGHSTIALFNGSFWLLANRNLLPAVLLQERRQPRQLRRRPSPALAKQRNALGGIVQ